MTMVEQKTCNTYAKKIPFFHKYRAKLKTKKLFGLFMMLGFFWEYWMWDTPSPTKPNMISHMSPSLDKYLINGSLPQIFPIKESWILIGWKVQLATQNQSGSLRYVTFPWWHSASKKYKISIDSFLRHC